MQTLRVRYKSANKRRAEGEHSLWKALGEVTTVFSGSRCYTDGVFFVGSSPLVYSRAPDGSLKEVEIEPDDDMAIFEFTVHLDDLYEVVAGDTAEEEPSP